MPLRQQLLNCWRGCKLADQQIKSFVSSYFFENNLCPLEIWCISKPVKLFEDIVFRTTSSSRITYYWIIHSMQILKPDSDKQQIKTCWLILKTLHFWQSQHVCISHYYKSILIRKDWIVKLDVSWRCSLKLYGLGASYKEPSSCREGYIGQKFHCYTNMYVNIYKSDRRIKIPL